MAIYHPTSVTCSCGTTFPCHVAHTLNVRRAPDIRGKILSGELHRVVCPRCKASLAVERQLSYVDPERNALFFVQPRGQRVDFRRDSKRLSAASKDLPANLSSKKGRQARVVYGLDELREKLVAQDLELDDRVVELLKILVVYEHPFLLKRARLQLFLTGEDGNKLRFVAYHHNRKEAWEAHIPTAIVDDLKGRERELRAWTKSAHKKEPLFSIPDSWVSFRRWTLRYEPLDALRTFARAAREGNTVALDSADFVRMLERMPRGNQLPGWAKQDLRTLFEYAKKKKGADATQDKLLEIRFGVELEDEWALNERPNDIDTIWQLLANMPVTNVEGNTHVREIDLIPGGDSYYGDGVIEIGEGALGNREGFEDVLRHEVGHAVHEELDAVVSPWLERRFGWREFPATQAGVNDWVNAMGGWNGIAGQARREIVLALLTCAGKGGTWDRGKPPRLPPGHPWWSSAFGPRLAYEKSQSVWYETCDEWHRANGTAFFINYWYATFMAVNASTLDDFVAKMPDRYAAMSRHEFFAEVYALYYDHDDPQRAVIADDAEVSAWLDANVGRHDPKNPRQPGRRTPAKRRPPPGRRKKTARR